jgi:hypothetical protein
VFDTLAASDPYVCSQSNLLEKGFDKGRFPNPWLTRHQDNLTLALECLLQPSV